jgi:hypothetical protein
MNIERNMIAFLFSGSAHEPTRFGFPKGRAAPERDRLG